MKENYKLIIEYTVYHFSGAKSSCEGRFYNLREFWRYIEEQYFEAIAVEIENIGIDW